MDTVILLGLVIGITQVLKVAFKITSRWIPLLSIVLSLLFVFIYVQLEKAPINWNLVVTGLVAALTSMGLWSGTKATIGK